METYFVIEHSEILVNDRLAREEDQGLIELLIYSNIVQLLSYVDHVYFTMCIVGSNQDIFTRLHFSSMYGSWQTEIYFSLELTIMGCGNIPLLEHRMRTSRHSLWCAAIIVLL